MTGRVIPFPAALQPYRGTVCVLGDKHAGLQVAHESASGDGWGSFSNYADEQEAISAAYALNRDVYLGGCDVSICDAALRDRDAGLAAPQLREDF